MAKSSAMYPNEARTTTQLSSTGYSGLSITAATSAMSIAQALKR